MRLSAEHPHDALARDEALLDEVEPGGPHLERWYVAASPAVIVGLGFRQRVSEMVDLGRCELHRVDVLHRQAGGGAVFVSPEAMLCGAICVPLPHALVGLDGLTESYRRLGEHLSAGLAALGVSRARRVEVADARRDVSCLKSSPDGVSRLLLSTCYGSLSPHEVVVGLAKIVGLAQIRRRHAALFQFGVLLQDQSALAQWLKVPDEASRASLKKELQSRTVGLRQLPVAQPDLSTLAHHLSLGSQGLLRTADR